MNATDPCGEYSNSISNASAVVDTVKWVFLGGNTYIENCMRLSSTISRTLLECQSACRAAMASRCSAISFLGAKKKCDLFLCGVFGRDARYKHKMWLGMNRTPGDRRSREDGRAPRGPSVKIPVI